MENESSGDFFRSVREKIGIIILFGLIFSLISFYAFIFTQKRYETTTDFLIIQEQEGNQDFYSLSKSAEYMGGVLSEAVYSSIFIEELKKTDKVSVLYFPSDGREALKKWKKAVKIERSTSLGIIKIKVYDNDKRVSESISQGISEIMINKNHLFRGKVNTEVRILSGPIVEKNPNLMEIILVICGGFLAGVAMKILHIYYKFVDSAIRIKEEEEYLRSLREIR